MGKDILASNIISAGAKFVVSNDTTDTTFGPGTTGFISFIKGHDFDYSDIVYMQGSIIKRGKTGKDRLDMAEMSFPIFLVDDPQMAKHLPDDKRKYYVKIEPVPMPANVMDMSNMDFLGWSYAYAHFVYKLSSKANRIKVWPSENSDLLNKFLNLNQYYDETHGGTISDFCNPDARRIFIEKIRILEATLMRCSLSYMRKLAELEVQAISDILKREIGDSGLVKTTLEEYKKKEKGLKDLEQSRKLN